MKKPPILVCDDQPKSVAIWRRRLQALRIPFSVEGLAGQSLSDAVAEMEERRERCRKARRPVDWEDHQFDRAAMLIIDYDLLHLDKSSYLTGENVAYLARCYSRCGLIIAVNQFDTNNAFDLTLKGHPESYADLNLGGDQVHNPGLWDKNWSGFRPWYWPLLPTAYKAFTRRVKALRGNLHQPILQYLGFPADTVKALPRTIREFLGTGKAPETTTFRKFVGNSGMGLRAKDKVLGDEWVARIAAARLGKWLERLVLPGQDILVDAPHLAGRYPSLLDGDLRKPTTWNKTSDLRDLRRAGLRGGRIESCRLRRQDWLSRPAWFWMELSKYETIREVRQPWSTEPPDFVFCEDVSRFLPRAEAREFVADVASPFARRFVVNPSSCEDAKLVKSLANVVHEPKVRFSM